MKKIIISVFVICMLLNILPTITNGEKITGKISSFNDGSLQTLNDENIFEEPSFIPGEILIKFKDDLNIGFSESYNGINTLGINSIDILSLELGVNSVEKKIINTADNSSNLYKFTLSNEANIVHAIEEYNKNPLVEIAEPNFVYHSFMTPNDLNFSEQWALNNAGQTGGTTNADIDAPEAWDIETGSSDAIIAVIDGGIDYNHPDLADNVWINDGEIPDNGIDDDGNGYIDDIRGWDFANDDNNPLDDTGHGTHCSGIAAAVVNNGIGISGVAPGCKIMALKSLDGGSGTNEDEIPAIIYAADNGAKVISMSFGGPYSSLLKDALDYAYSKGVLLVAAAGNAGLDLCNYPMYPVCFNNVIGVAATDHNDSRAIFPNGGSSDYGPFVDIAAPGNIIYSTTPTYEINGISMNYHYGSGTSMACPHVAGLAGLLFSKNQSLTNDMVKTIILNTADEIETDEYIGRGRINAYNALLRDPALAILDRYSDWANTTGLYDITGSAWGENFQYYSIEYGKGRYPDIWVEIENSTITVEKGVLTSWNTNNLEDGFYTIRLKVLCDDGIYIDTENRVVNNEVDRFIVDDDNSDGPWNGTEQHPYKEIQDGVDNAGVGDTVFVYSGLTYKGVNIDRSIQLIGEDKNTTIISEPKDLVSICVYADNVTISGFTIEGSLYAIYLYSVSDCIIKDNIVKDGGFADIKLLSSSNNKIYQNIIEDEGLALSLYSSYNIIMKNIFEMNYNGIKIYQQSSNNTIIKNYIGNSTNNGINILGSGHNIISENTIKNCGKYGIEIKTHNNICSDSNLIYHNNFFNNLYNSYDECINYWNITTEGNYWDDYTGIDSDSDGIGDRPYDIAGESNQDLYPLMEPYGSEEPPENTELAVTINDGICIGKVSANVENIGDIDAVNVNLSLHVEYGFLGHEKPASIEFSYLISGEISDSLKLDDLKAIGPITVTATATADNTETVETTASGWIIGRLIILIP